MQIEKESDEEIEIYGIVEEILRLEDKIAEMNHFNENKSSNREVIDNVKAKEKHLYIAKELNEEMTCSLMPYRSMLTVKIQELERIKEKIANANKQLNQMESLSKGNIYKISSEKIKEIINSKKSSDDIKTIEQEIESAMKIRSMLYASLSDYRNKCNALLECGMMIKEEKETYRVDIVNLISQKESIEELIKIHQHHQDFNDNSLKMIHINKKEIEVYHYEVEKLNENTILKISQSIIESMKELPNQNSNSNNINAKDVHISNIIQDTLIKYTKTQNNHKKSPDEVLIELSSKILRAINPTENKESNTSNDENSGYSIESLSTYLNFLIKINYIEEVLQQRMLFTTKEYKINKKNIIKQINSIQNSITKLNTQLEEIELRINDYKRKKSYIIENNKPKGLIELSTEEKDYIQLNGNLTEFHSNQKDIELTIEDISSKIKEIEIEYEKKLIQLEIEEQLQVKALQKELDINKDHDKNSEENCIDFNHRINALQKQIDDNYFRLKSKLLKCKESFNGNNISLYNKLVDCINNKTNTRNTFISKSNSYSQTITDKSINSISSHIELTKSKHPLCTSFQLYNCKSDSIKSPSMSYANSMSKAFMGTALKIPNGNYTKNNYDHPHLKPNHKNQSSSLMFLSKKPMIHTRNISFGNENLKLNKTIKHFKAKISKAKYIANKYSMQKRISLLKENVVCYYRNITHDKERKFNPLMDTIPSDCFDFSKAILAIDDSCSKMLLRDYSIRENVFVVSIDAIENTIVSNITKQIVVIVRAIRRHKGSMEIEKIINIEEIAAMNLAHEDKVSSFNNKYFNFSIKIKGKHRMEFVFLKYEQFKIWLNGLRCLVKDKNTTTNN